MENDAMRNEKKVREIIHILIGSKFYFSFSVQERYDFIKNIIRRFPFSS